MKLTMRTHCVFLLLTAGLFFISCNSVNYNGNLNDELLKISKEAEIKFVGNNPDLSVYGKKIAEITKSIKNQINNKQPEDILKIMNRTIFDDLGIQPMPDSTDITFDCLTILLRTRRASCVGLTGLYLVLAEQIDLPLYAVLVPGHMFVRYQNGSNYIDVETLRKGIHRTDEFYKKYFSPDPNKSYYLKNLTGKEFIAVCLFNLGNEYAKRGLYENAINKYNSVSKLFPDFEEVKGNLKNTYFQHDKIKFKE